MPPAPYIELDARAGMGLATQEVRLLRGAIANGWDDTWYDAQFAPRQSAHFERDHGGVSSRLRADTIDTVRTSRRVGRADASTSWPAGCWEADGAISRWGSRRCSAIRIQGRSGRRLTCSLSDL